MIELAGTTYYFSDLGLWAYGLVYVPAVILAAIVIYRLGIRRLGRPWKGGLLTLSLCVGLSWPFWDVYRIGQEATRLCREEGGLHVYRTAEAEGFLGASSIEYWSKYGFSYVEKTYSYGKEIVRYALRKGIPIQEKISEIKSRYELVSSSTRITNKIIRHKDFVRDLTNKYVLGDLTFFSISAGDFDGFIFGATGLTFIPWYCGNSDPAQPGIQYTRSILHS